MEAVAFIGMVGILAILIYGMVKLRREASKR